MAVTIFGFLVRLISYRPNMCRESVRLILKLDRVPLNVPESLDH
jgi:hypothetical protein